MIATIGSIGELPMPGASRNDNKTGDAIQKYAFDLDEQTAVVDQLRSIKSKLRQKYGEGRFSKSDELLQKLTEAIETPNDEQ